MAIGKKTGGRVFQKGVSGNPNGRPRLPQELRDFRLAAKKDIIEEIKNLWSLTDKELKKITIENNDEPAIRKRLADMILNGDLKEVLDRTIGKVKEEIDVNTNISFHKRVVDFINQIEDGTSEDLE
jgi:hypothetical protein